ncbi:MAG: hypothetical protein AB7F19_01885 [Candidatus Babeliales bacterium]
MLYKVKNNICYALGLLTLASLITLLIGVRYGLDPHSLETTDFVPTAQAPYASSAQPFLDRIDTLMTTTWQQLEQDLHIDYSTCKAFIDEYGNELKTDILRDNRRIAKKSPKISASILEIVYEILNDFGIDPRSISIISYDGQGSPAGADDYTLHIDENAFASYSPEAQRFIIAHEISHMKNRDHTFASALASLLECESNSRPAAFHAFERATELRADIHAMLKHPDYAQGGISFFQALLDRNGDGRGITHPRPSERLKVAHDIQAMHAMQAQKLPITGLITA